MRKGWRICLALIGLLLTATTFGAEPDTYDRFHDDDTSATLNRLSINVPQIHTIHEASDEDWATFFAEEGLPYRIKVEDVGPGLDPELWVYPDGPDQPGFLTDFGAFGEDETYARLIWPASGGFWLRVRAAATTAGATTYTLTVARETGANLGLATISGTHSRAASTGGDVLTLPATIPLHDGSTTTLLYTETSLAYPSGTFLDGQLPWLLLSGMGDPIHDLDRPWVTHWHDRFPSNFTITRVGIAPAVVPHHALELTIQMRTEAVVRDVTDGRITWPDTHLQDVAPGDQPEDIRVYRWNPAAGSWYLYDASPAVTASPSGWLVTTLIDRPVLSLASSDLFAAAVEASSLSVIHWDAYP